LKKTRFRKIKDNPNDPQPQSGDLFVTQHVRNALKPRSGDLYGIWQMDAEKKKFLADLRRWYRRLAQMEGRSRLIAQKGE
jgi:hypothetical protein